MATVGLSLSGMEPLIKTLNGLPYEMRRRVIVPVFEKTIKTVERSITALIPYQVKKRRGGYHFKTVMTSVVRQYPATESVVAVTGPESGLAPHAHLVEDGTGPRYTNSKTSYRRMATHVRTVIKRGQIARKVEKQRKSIGSKIRRKTKPQFYRGVMPAIHPVARGLAAVESTVREQIETGIRNGITRELTAAKIGRGK